MRQYFGCPTFQLPLNHFFYQHLFRKQYTLNHQRGFLGKVSFINFLRLPPPPAFLHSGTVLLVVNHPDGAQKQFWQLNMIDRPFPVYNGYQPLKRFSCGWKFLADSFLPSVVGRWRYFIPAPSTGPGFPGSSERQLSEHDRAHWFNACRHPTGSVEAHTKSRHTNDSHLIARKQASNDPRNRKCFQL